MRRTKSQSSEMDVLALDPATTAYLQARGHQEALMAALEGPDLSHGLDRTDKVGGAGGLMGRGEANRKGGVGPHVQRCQLLLLLL